MNNITTKMEGSIENNILHITTIEPPNNFLPNEFNGTLDINSKQVYGCAEIKKDNISGNFTLDISK